MNEQQQHLKDLLAKRESLQKELELLQVEANSKKELFFKTQGIIEYLVQMGVKLPENYQNELNNESIPN